MIFIISGPSGSGKTTLARKLLKHLENDSFTRSISYTTRPPRSGEREGRDYYFINKDDFLRLRRTKKILEWTQYLGYYYATSRAFVEKALAQGRHVILCLDYQGVKKIKQAFPGRVISIFVIPPSLDELHQRISRRAHTSAVEIRERLRMGERELKIARKYDYRIVNKELDEATCGLTDLVSRLVTNKAR